MRDNLSVYRKKRNFNITSEPQGGRSKGETLSFVIQKHAASRLHYDFRLELDGTLKSWAVPKGPSLDPKEKRMAVHVEDHPLDYGGFEGVIPPKQYGAGTVIVWDRGEWVPIGDPHATYKAGKLKFELRGEKLQGRWTLVRMRGRGDERQEPWLLIKEHDEYERPSAEYSVVDERPESVLSGVSIDEAGAQTKGAARKAVKKKAAPEEAQPPAGARKAKLPLTFAPQLATLVEGVPPEGEWLYEVKYDGYRLLTRIEGGKATLFTRNGHDWTAKMKTLAKAIEAMKLEDGWLDGEIVVQGPRGVPDFQLLQNAFESARTNEILYFVFDLPYYAGYDLREVPLRTRREVLQRVMQVDPQERVRFSEALEAAPQSLLRSACEMRMEGLIGKRADSSYVSRRSPHWIKLKCTQRQEFVIGGYTDPKGTRVGLGSLLLGIHDEKGRLQYAGNVGTGFNIKLLSDLTAKLESLRTDKTPFDPLPKGIKGHWVKPKLVAEVSFGEWTREGRVRHSVFHGLRTDKPAAVITKEKAVAPAKRAKTKAAARGAKTETTAAATLPPGIKITHPERVIDASTGITKAEMADYYARAASLVVPHLKERPVSLVRAPEGIGGELFFQKHGARLKIPGIKHLDPNIDTDHEPLLEVPNAQALLGSVQMNVIEFHTWNATTRAIEQPDRMSFDLDPGEGVKWAQMQEAADLVRVMLEELGLRSFLKTSGGKGLHVIVPCKPQLEWEAFKAFTQTIVQHLARTLPDRFVAKSGPKNRVGRIFIDYLRNGRGATTASAWSARARPGIGVSVPVDWAELSSLKSGAHWTVRNVDERLDLEDPWAEYGSAKRQTVNKALKVLDFAPPKKK
jgi:bifunctional non-homologous end joining protein LigD